MHIICMVCKHIIWWYHTKTKQLIYLHSSKYFQVFLYDISLFSNDSFFYYLLFRRVPTDQVPILKLVYTYTE